MPFYRYTTRIRTQRLNVVIKHTLHEGGFPTECSPSASEPEAVEPRVTAIRRLKDLDILPYSPQLSFAISGSNDGIAMTADQMCASGVAQHLLRCMRSNADFLRIHSIRDIEVNGGIATISFTSSHPISDAPDPSTLKFVSLKFIYAWSSGPNGEGEDIQAENPMTSSKVTPFAALLDDVVRRLFSRHVLPHYPLIFGPYAHTIRAEQAMFPIVAKSLWSIVNNSTNQDFKDQAWECVKKLRRRNSLRAREIHQAIEDLGVSTSNSTEESQSEIKNDCDEFEDFSNNFSRALTDMFRRRIKPWSKGLRVNTQEDNGTTSTSPCFSEDEAWMSKLLDIDYPPSEHNNEYLEELDDSDLDWSVLEDGTGADLSSRDLAFQVHDYSGGGYMPHFSSSPALSDSESGSADSVINFTSRSSLLSDESELLIFDDEFDDVSIGESHDVQDLHSILQPQGRNLLGKPVDSQKDTPSDFATNFYSEPSGVDDFFDQNSSQISSELDSCMSCDEDAILDLEDSDSDMEILLSGEGNVETFKW